MSNLNEISTLEIQMRYMFASGLLQKQDLSYVDQDSQERKPEDKEQQQNSLKDEKSTKDETGRVPKNKNSDVNASKMANSSQKHTNQVFQRINPLLTNKGHFRYVFPDDAGEGSSQAMQHMHKMASVKEDDTPFKL